MDEGLAEAIPGAAEERTGSVLTAIRVVLLQSILLMNKHAAMLRVTFVGKPDIMSGRVGVAEQQIGDAWG